MASKSKIKPGKAELERARVLIHELPKLELDEKSLPLVRAQIAELNGLTYKGFKEVNKLIRNAKLEPYLVHLLTTACGKDVESQVLSLAARLDEQAVEYALVAELDQVLQTSDGDRALERVLEYMQKRYLRKDFFGDEIAKRPSLLKHLAEVTGPEKPVGLRVQAISNLNLASSRHRLIVSPFILPVVKSSLVRARKGEEDGRFLRHVVHWVKSYLSKDIDTDDALAREFLANVIYLFDAEIPPPARESAITILVNAFQSSKTRKFALEQGALEALKRAMRYKDLSVSGNALSCVLSLCFQDRHAVLADPELLDLVLAILVQCKQDYNNSKRHEYVGICVTIFPLLISRCTPDEITNRLFTLVNVPFALMLLVDLTFGNDCLSVLRAFDKLKQKVGLKRCLTTLLLKQNLHMTKLVSPHPYINIFRHREIHNVDDLIICSIAAGSDPYNRKVSYRRKTNYRVMEYLERQRPALFLRVQHIKVMTLLVGWSILPRLRRDGPRISRDVWRRLSNFFPSVLSDSDWYMDLEEGDDYEPDYDAEDYEQAQRDVLFRAPGAEESDSSSDYFGGYF